MSTSIIKASFIKANRTLFVYYLLNFLVFLLFFLCCGPDGKGSVP